MRRALLLAVLTTLLAPSAASAIFGGREAAPDEAPWAATLVAPGRPLPQGERCSGALIAPDRVLTAAHCVQGVKPTSLRVLLGGARLTTLGPAVRARATWFPPSYREIPSPRFPDTPSASAAVNDVALVLLAQPAPAGTPVLALAAATPPAGTAAATYGHGRMALEAARDGEQTVTRYDPSKPVPGPTDELRVAEQTVLDAAACREAHGALHRPGRHLCTLGAPPDRPQACGGDSGGPVVVAGVATGVVSWGGETQGRGCGHGLPDVAELVAPHRAGLLAQHPPAAPWVRVKPHVRVQDATAACSAGRWAGAPRLSYRWVRPARYVGRRNRRGTLVDIQTIPERTIGHGSRLRLRRHRAVCVVRASTDGGWTIARSSNAAPARARG